MLGNLVVHVEEYAKVDLEEITNKVIETVMDSESKQFVNHLEVKRVRLNPNAGITHESGQCVRVRKSSVGGGATADDGYWQGTLGCFAKGCVNGANEKMFVLSCAHVFPDGCSHIVEIPRANSQTEFDVIGEFNPEYRLLWENKLDIVAISVNPSARNKCHLWLKNSGGCDDWKVVPHEGDLKQLLGYQVYKWGSVTNLTQGMVVCVNYKSYGQTGFGDQYNIFIRSPPDSSSLFSLQGDSGSVVCFDDSFQETVRVLSLINGDMTDIASGKVICSYSCHLKKNLDALAERTNRNFELYNH